MSKEKPIRAELNANGCWICISHKAGGNGYPCVKRGGRYQKISRYLFEMSGVKLSRQELVLHACDEPLCVNMAHLRVGTHEENMQDRCARKRTATRERHGMSKLTEQKVTEIRILLRNGVSTRKLATKFGVSQATIMWVKKNLHWREYV